MQQIDPQHPSGPKERLHTCPDCGLQNLTGRGLVAHRGGTRCQETKAQRETPQIVELLPVEPQPKSLAIVPTSHATTPVTLQVLDAMPVVVAKGDEWGRARQIVGALKSAAQGMLALQVMAGFELIALRKEHGVKRGGDRRSNPHGVGLKWEVIVNQELGISDQTAARWMEMAKAVAPRLKKLGGDFCALPLLELPPHLFSPEQQELLSRGVAKLTDARTQLDFLIELGLAKGQHGAGGGHDPKKDKKEKLTPEEEEAVCLAACKEDLLTTAQMLEQLGLKYTAPTITDAERDAFINLLRSKADEIAGFVKTPVHQRSLVSGLKLMEGK